MFHYLSNSPPLLRAKKDFARFIQRIFLPVMILASISSALAAEPVSVSVPFESQGLKLSSGVIVDRSVGLFESDDADLYFAYHADRTPHATLMPSSGTEMALVPGTSMSDVTVSDITEATFSVEVIDQPLESDSSALLRLADGSVYLIGNASESDQGVSFQYMQVE